MKSITGCFAKAGTALALLALAVGIGVLAVGFLSAALFLGLVKALGMPLAAMVTGAVLTAAVALLLVVARLLVSKSTIPSLQAQQTPDNRAAAQIGEMLGIEAGLWTKRHPGIAMLAALTTGFAVGSSPELRAKLLRLFQ